MNLERSARCIEIQGTWLANAGARQMLAAAARALRADPSVELAIDPRWGAREHIRAQRLRRIVPRSMPGGTAAERALAIVTRAVPHASARTLEARGLIERRQLDGLVDASGFALSDQWGAGKARQRWDVVRRYAATGRPVVLLPQAMGPFTNPETAASARAILRAASLVYVRDAASLAHASALVGDSAEIRRAPDITILEPGVAPDGIVADVVLVPNARLVDQGGWASDAYLEALEGCGRAALRVGRSVEVVRHTDESGDRALAAELGARLGCGVVVEHDEARAKGRLSAADLVVGSRYHALLGALSTGTPAVALGWSHKYDELFDDFGIPELSAPRAADGRKIVEQVADALDHTDDLRARVASRLPELRAEVEVMWTACRDALGLTGARGAAPTSGLR